MHTIKRANASSAPLSEVGISVVRGMETEQQEMAGEAPSATARFYSNGRNSYSCLVPCARRPSKMQAALLPCSVHFVRSFVAFVNAFSLVSTGCKMFVQTQAVTELLVRINLHRGYPTITQLVFWSSAERDSTLFMKCSNGVQIS